MLGCISSANELRGSGRSDSAGDRTLSHWGSFVLLFHTPHPLPRQQGNSWRNQTLISHAGCQPDWRANRAAWFPFLYVGRSLRLPRMADFQESAEDDGRDRLLSGSYLTLGTGRSPALIVPPLAKPLRISGVMKCRLLWVRFLAGAALLFYLTAIGELRVVRANFQASRSS